MKVALIICAILLNGMLAISLETQTIKKHHHGKKVLHHKKNIDIDIAYKRFVKANKFKHYKKSKSESNTDSCTNSQTESCTESGSNNDSCSESDSYEVVKVKKPHVVKKHAVLKVGSTQ